MNAISQISASPQPSGISIDDPDPTTKVKKAGQQFESLLIGELLRMTHGEGESWLGSGEDSSSSCAMGLAEESLAQAFSSQGGFGLANLVTKSLMAAAADGKQ